MLYPNPSKEAFNIKSDEVILSIKIYSILGKLVFQKQHISAKSFKVEALLPKGNYILTLITAKGIQNKKFIVN